MIQDKKTVGVVPFSPRQTVTFDFDKIVVKTQGLAMNIREKKNALATTATWGDIAFTSGQEDVKQQTVKFMMENKRIFEELADS